MHDIGNKGVEQWSYKTAAWQMQIAKEWDMVEKVLGKDAMLEMTVNQFRKVTAEIKGTGRARKKDHGGNNDDNRTARYQESRGGCPG